MTITAKMKVCSYDNEKIVLTDSNGTELHIPACDADGLVIGTEYTLSVAAAASDTDTDADADADA